MHLNEFIKCTSIHSLNKYNNTFISKYISIHSFIKQIHLNTFIKTNTFKHLFNLVNSYIVMQKIHIEKKNENLIVVFSCWVHFKLVAVDVTKFLAYIILSLWCHCYPCCFAFINFCMKKLNISSGVRKKSS